MAMSQREHAALADLHADAEEKDSSDKEPVVITGINFKAINDIYEKNSRQKTKASKSANDLEGSWYGAQKTKKMTRTEMNQLFTKKTVKNAELSDQAFPERNRELFE